MNIVKWLENYMPAQRVTCKSDLIEHLNTFVSKGIIDKDEHTMLADVLDFSTMRARDIMIPRAQIISLDKNDDLDHIFNIMVKSKHSRYPVVDKSIDNIQGVLLAKDIILFTHERENRKKKGIDHLLRTASFVPESIRLDSLLKHFQSSHNHMAITVDEYGSVSGVITIEDVIEQITGDIEDEHDQHETMHYFKKVYPGCYHVDALAPIDDFNIFFSQTLPNDYFDTIGGIVAQKFGRVPKPGDSCKINNLTVHVLHATNKKIKSIEVVAPNNLPNQPNT